MKKNKSNWEKELPPLEDLTPLSQTLITPHLAGVLNLYTTKNATNSQLSPPLTHPSSSEFENSGDLGSGVGDDEPARTLKRPRLVWTPQLHTRFVDAVAHLGIKNAVPKTIMQLMNVDGLTRENVASHLQKYRLYLKRMQGHSNGDGGRLGSVDPVTDHLFASLPVPSHFGAHHGQQHFINYVTPVQTGRPIWVTHPQLQQQFHQQRRMEQFRSPLKNGQSHSQQPEHRNGVPFSTYEDDFKSGTANGTRKILTLFPTGDN